MSTVLAEQGRRKTNGLSGLSDMLLRAQAGHYAVGAFNYCNSETGQAVFEAADALRSPIMLITGPWEIPMLGARTLVNIASELAATVDLPVCLHLDHATDVDLVKECIDAGFPSVMIDGSHFDFEENVRLTRQVVELAHPLGITVEGELGSVGRVDDSTVEGSNGSSLADPAKAIEFVKRTGIDALAVGIGNAHGIYTQRPELEFDLLQEVRNGTDVPLVLHGGSGTPRDQLLRAIDIGISKVNVASEIGRAYLNAIHEADKDGKAWYAHALLDAKNAARVVVERWMKELGSAGRA